MPVNYCLIGNVVLRRNAIPEGSGCTKRIKQSPDKFATYTGGPSVENRAAYEAQMCRAVPLYFTHKNRDATFLRNVAFDFCVTEYATTINTNIYWFILM